MDITPTPSGSICIEIEPHAIQYHIGITASAVLAFCDRFCPHEARVSAPRRGHVTALFTDAQWAGSTIVNAAKAQVSLLEAFVKHANEAGGYPFPCPPEVLELACDALKEAETWWAAYDGHRPWKAGMLVPTVRRQFKLIDGIPVLSPA